MQYIYKYGVNKVHTVYINLHVYDITVSCTYSIMDIDTQEQAWF